MGTGNPATRSSQHEEAEIFRRFRGPRVAWIVPVPRLISATGQLHCMMGGLWAVRSKCAAVAGRCGGSSPVRRPERSIAWSAIATTARLMRISSAAPTPQCQGRQRYRPVRARYAEIHQGAGSHCGAAAEPKGLYRWYATCCNTPVGNTLGPAVPSADSRAALDTGGPMRVRRAEVRNLR